ncbi:MAG: hypothetical protein COB99_04230 [Sulfurimonas sp.]|nr:MAG: hypothetical protein COB99_04230 [Sulfurimonas sp.]
MEISTIDIILIISTLLNFFLLNKLSKRNDIPYLEEKISQLDEHLEKSVVKNKKFIKNFNFHNEMLINSIIYHLHASGTSHIDKIWETYNSEVKEEWPEDKAWPSYLPIEGNPEQKYPKINLEEYNQWLCMIKGNTYKKYPSEVINHDYIWKMK